MQYKKFMALQLLSTLFIVCMFLISSSALASQTPVAVITNYDDIEENIVITRSDGEPEGAEAFLYPDDRITGEIELVQIECAPYAELNLQGEAYIVSYNPPSGILGVTASICSKASSFWVNTEGVTAGISRGADNDLDLIPQPGYDVTLLKDCEVRFSWNAQDNAKFFIKDEQGKIVFEKTFNGVNYVDLVPANLKLSEGKSYVWGLDDSFEEYKFKILDSQMEKDLLSKLAEIDGEKLTEPENVLKKAEYLQLISDMFSETVDLYWLSLQLLSGMNTYQGLEAEKNMLLNRCRKHLDMEM